MLAQKKVFDVVLALVECSGFGTRNDSAPQRLIHPNAPTTVTTATTPPGHHHRSDQGLRQILKDLAVGVRSQCRGVEEHGCDCPLAVDQSKMQQAAWGVPAGRSSSESKICFLVLVAGAAVFYRASFVWLRRL